MDPIQNVVGLCHHTVKSVGYSTLTYGTHEKCDVPILEKEALVPSESTRLCRSCGWYTRARRFYRQVQWLGRDAFHDGPARQIGRSSDGGIGGDNGRCGWRPGAGYWDGFGVLGYVQTDQTGKFVWTHSSSTADEGTTSRQLARTRSAVI
jgi:hypothetical protein